jgi:hypothetical protein
MGMEVQGLAIPAFGTQMGATVSSRELRRRSRVTDPCNKVVDAEKTAKVERAFGLDRKAPLRMAWFAGDEDCGDGEQRCGRRCTVGFTGARATGIRAICRMRNGRGWSR